MRNKKIAMAAILAAVICAAWPGRSAAETLKSFDGYGLDYSLEYPQNGKASRIVILIHGSGPQDMDEDLGAVSAPGVKNLFFVDVSSALRNKGFAVLRYNKRSFQVRDSIKKDPQFVKSAMFKNFSDNPLRYFVDDASAVADFAAKEFPKTRLYLLGHSQGTFIALTLADSDPRIKGVALIGFMAQSLDVAMFEQMVYRPMALFARLDKDGNSLLDGGELGADKTGKILLAQLPVLDLDSDGKISRSEFMAGNFSNLLLDMAPSMRAYRRQEAEYKRPGELLRDLEADVSFFQGELDNQTPLYGVKAVELLNKAAWKKHNLHFHYFPGLGHALDPRDDYQDILFRPAEGKALAVMASELASRWE